MAACSEAETRRGALLIRSRAGDTAGARPIEPCAGIESSPDLSLAGGTDEAVAIQGVEHTLSVRVTNAGSRPLEDISVEAWVCDHAAGALPLGQLEPPGRMTGFLPGPLAPGAEAVIGCAPAWTPDAAAVALGDGRVCLAANVSADRPRDGAALVALAVLKPCCDTHHARRDIVVRAPAPPAPVITTIAGTGERGSAGDGGPAVEAQLSLPTSVAVTPDGEILIGDTANHLVRLVTAAGTMLTIAGSGVGGFSGDGGRATAARLNSPHGVVFAPGLGFLVADLNNERVRVIGPGGISTLAHYTGVPGPSGLAVRQAGVYVANAGMHVVMFRSPSGVEKLLAGRTRGLGGDGGDAALAALDTPSDVAVRPNGSVLIADKRNHRIRLVAGGTITTVAGTTQGFGGDDGPAVQAQLAWPSGIAVLPGGAFLIADTQNHRVRHVSAGGVITTIAGTGEEGFSGDGGTATAARLNKPRSVALAADGSVLIADSENHCIRRIDRVPGGERP
jgi:NHL repeat-containing protein